MGKKAGTVNISEVAKAAAVEALKLQREEDRQRTRKNRFHNTELLLKNYLSLLDHAENAKDKASDIMDLEELDVDEVIIMAIKRSRVRTNVMINQIQTCMYILKIRLIERNQEEKYEVIRMMYMDPKMKNMSWTEKTQLIANYLNCGTVSVHRWKNEIIRELSILLFGIDGLKLDL